MPASDTQARNLKRIAALCASALVLLAGWAAWHFSTLGHAQADLDRELALARLDGLALEPEEIRDATYVPDLENAAPLVRRAIEQLKAWRNTPEGKQVSELSERRKGIVTLKPAEIDEIRPGINRLTGFFATLDRAVKLKKLDFARNWQAGPAMLFPEMSDERECASLLLLKARSDTLEGSLDSALDSIDTAAKLSSLTGQDPVIIGLLVQVGMRTQVCDLLDELVKTHADNLALLRRVRSILGDLGPQPDVRPAIRSEFVLGRMAVRMLANTRQSADMFGADAANGVTRLARIGAVRTVYELRFVQVYRHMFQSLSKNPSSIVSMTKSFTAEDAEISKNSGHDWTYGLAEVIAPVFGGVAGAIGESEARRNVLLASLDVLEYQRKNGTFPLKALGETAHWLDPFTEKPLIYRPSANGFLIYSVARDGMDDGGKPRKKDFADQRYDIPFAYP